MSGPPPTPVAALRRNEVVTFGLANGQQRTGRMPAFAPQMLDLTLEEQPAKPGGAPSKVSIAAESIAYIGFHRVQTEGVTSRADPAARNFRIHVIHGRVFAVQAALGAMSHPIGFYGTPLDAQGPFKEIFFYAHGVNAREQHDPIGTLLVKEGVLAPKDLQRGLDQQNAHRATPLGQILVEQARVPAAAVEQAASLQDRRRLRIGEALVEAGLATREDIEAGLTEQRKRGGKRLGEVLIEMKVISEVDLALTLAKKFHLPFVSLENYPINPAAALEVPRAIIEKYQVFPVETDPRGLTVATSDPLLTEAIDVLRVELHKRIHEVVVAPKELRRFIATYLATAVPVVEGKRPDPARVGEELDQILQDLATEESNAPGADAEEEEAKVADAIESDSAVIKLANQVIRDGIRSGASDIHIEPNGRERPMVVRFRIDGECVAYQDIPASFRGLLVARLKIMARLDISERRKPQDGKIRMKVADQVVELRVATIPTANDNEDVVMRILAASKPMPLDQMGMSERNLRELNVLIRKPYGLVLCVGPTGSGKTTTLHSALGSINTVDMKIWTAEDPVEITQHGLRQVQVHAKIGFTFAAAMRAFLRADPDVIMVGEMRDAETAGTAIEASLTGHLVMSTLHTNSAAETITRLLDMGLDPFSFSDALLGVLAQRLARRLCTKCREAYTPTEEEFAELQLAYGEEALDRQLHISTREGVKLWRGRGCPACGDTGYKGRLALHELLVSDDAVRRAVARRSPVEEIRRAAIEQGMTTLVQDGVVKAIAGLTDLKQVLAVAAR